MTSPRPVQRPFAATCSSPRSAHFHRYGRFLTPLSALGLLVACEAAEQPPVIQFPECTVEFSTFRISEIELPTTATRSAQLAIDLDEDELIDNAGGGLISSFVQFWEDGPELLTSHVQALVDDDELVWVLRVGLCSDGSPNSGDFVRMQLIRGEVLPGSGAIRLAEHRRPATGVRREDGGFSVRGGAGETPASAFADMIGLQPSIRWVDGDGLAVEAILTADGNLTGGLVIGLHPEIREVVGVVMADFYTEMLPTGRSEYAVELDANGDDIVTPQEFLEDGLSESLLQLDVDLMAMHDEQETYWPNHDQVKDRLSMGIGFVARPVAIEE